MENIETINSETIINNTCTNTEVHTLLTKSFIENFSFYGKSLDEWGRYLQVVIPENPAPVELRELFSRTANKTQVAAHYLSVANMINTSLVNGSTEKKAEIISQIVEHYANIDGKRPAAKIIESMAASYLDTNSTITASKIVKEFFKLKLEGLIEVRKSLEQMNLTITSELKYMS